MLRKAAVACLALVALGALILAFWSKLPTPLPWQRPRGAPSLDAPPVAIPAPPRALIVGTGSEPASTQVSIEQDVALAAEILRAPALVLFAGGRGAQSVVELDSDTAPTLRERLGALFGAQNEPSATFRPTRLAPDGPATVNHLLDSLERSLAAGEGPLVVYWAGHGEPGEEPRANLARMWGGFPVGPEDLAEVLEGESTRRQAQLVMTTCFSGGFAEIVFRNATASEGPADAVHCGLFASTWDAEASGCDPDPERARQEGFGLHFLNALRGRDRSGQPLDAGEIDVDGDGAISLLEAHARARIASRGIEVPTTSSERFLRAAFDALGGDAGEAHGAAVELLPEDARVVERLGAQLGASTLEEASSRLDAIAAELEAQDERLAEAEAVADDAFHRLRIALLERWPSLDDPWHRRFTEDLERDGDAIAEVLDHAIEAHLLRTARRRVDAQLRALGELEQRRARAERLLRAHENLALAAELARLPSPALDRYRALLACERAAPFPLEGTTSP